ncbi:MAG: amidohydrolase [Acidobacteriota bacterium]
MAARLTAYLVAFIVGITLIAGLIVGAQREDGPVDLIILNARVYTADGNGTMAEAVAVQGNKILVVGTNREVQRLRRPRTEVIDAQGGAVLPGFIDAHLHLLSGGLALSQISLLEARTLADIETTVREWAAAHPERAWVTGRGWFYGPFGANKLPTRQQLDALVPDRPAYLTSYDGHTGWANSRALAAAKITRRTPDPPDGIIVRDARGEATGALKEAAMALVTKVLPQPTREQQLAALQAAIGEAHRQGVTSVHTASGSADDLSLLDELRAAHKLDLRVYAALSAAPDIGKPELDAFDALRAKYPDDPLLKTGSIKLIADGVVEAMTAALLEPYATKPAVRGEARMDAATLNGLVAQLDERGWQVMVHAIGDRAVRMALDAFEAAARRGVDATRPRRHRIEHIETIDPADVPRFGALGVIASMQPYHSLPDPAGGVWSTNLGPERTARAWMYGSIARAGGRLAFGSDWPVVSMNPMSGLFVAVNRTTFDGEPAGGWAPMERLPLPAAIDAYTRDAAWTSFDEHRKGSLQRDMLADLVVLEQDIFADAPASLKDASVAVTVFDGKIVYTRAANTTEAETSAR